MWGWSVVVSIYFPFDTHYEIVEHTEKYEVSCYEYVNKQKHEIFSVPKTNTIINPWAVMIHVQDTSIACGTVMTSLRLEYITHQAISSAFVLRITQMKSLYSFQLFIAMDLTQNTGTCPGSVVIAWKNDHTSSTKNTWKNANSIST